MKKTIIALIVLLIAAGVSVGAFLGVKKNKENDDKKQASERADLNLLQFDSESIKKIDFDCADGNYTVELNDGLWSLTSEDQFPLDQTYLQLLCTYSGQLTAETSFSSDNPAEYGLDKPDKITLSDGENSYKIYVGNASPTGDYYYISIDGRDKIYAVKTTYGSVLKAEKMMLKSKDFIPYDSSQIAEITVIRSGKTVYDLSYDKDQDTWAMSEDFSNLTFDVTSVTTMVANLTRLSASFENMLDENLTDLSKYGFDSPTAEAVFKGLDGSECRFLFNDKLDPKGNYTYVLEKNSGQVTMFSKFDVDFINYTPLDFLLTNMPIADITRVRSVEFTFDGAEKETYSMNVKENKANCCGKDIDLSDGSMNIAFRNFFNSFAVLKISAIDMEASPDLKDPILTAVFGLEDGSEKTYQLTDAGNGKYYAFINGEYIGALMDAERVKGINSIADFRERLFKAAEIDID